MKILLVSMALVGLSVLTACGGGSVMGAVPPPPAQKLQASVSVSNTTNGAFNLAMSTSFQPAEWDDTFFCTPGACTPQTWSAARMTLLGNLQPHHIRLQGFRKACRKEQRGRLRPAGISARSMRSRNRCWE